MKAQEIIEKLEKLELHNQVSQDARDNIINYVDANVDDVDTDEVDLDGVYHDLANTLGGSWLVYNQEIADYFCKNKGDIDEVLFEGTAELQLDPVTSIQDLIQKLTFSAYELALYNLIYNDLQ